MGQVPIKDFEFSSTLNVTLDDNEDLGPSGRWFEEEPTELQSGISIQRLTKVSLNLYWIY